MKSNPQFVAAFAVLILTSFLICCGDSKDQEPATDPGTAAKATMDDGKTGLAPKPIDKRIKDAIDVGIKFVQQYQDPATGYVGFSPADKEKTRHPGIAAMTALAYMNSPRHYTVADDGPWVRNILKWLVSLQKDDGSIFERTSANYVTSLALAALVKGGPKRYADAIEKARDFIVRLQAREDTGYQPNDRFYGGVGYGSDLRPDLSNAQFAIEAVKAADLPADHPFYTRAVKFLERSQNWSETNDQVWKDKDGQVVKPGNDGGAIYRPGESKAGVEIAPDGSRSFKSYGSMSYALLKSYLFCGLKKQDPRVKAVVRWCQSHFNVDKHPGFAAGKSGNGEYQGLYYYYLSMAKCLRVYGDLEFEGPAGVKVNWPLTLAEKILTTQKSDGSWSNDKSGRWEEASELLCTLYALATLEECLAAIQS